MQRSALDQKWAGYVVAGLSVVATTIVLKLLGDHVNAATVSLALLLNVLFIATRWGSWPALLASIVAMLCFNFFFLPPFKTFNIAATDNWIALVAFLVTAVTAGQLSARAKNRAEEAELRKREIERLYAELRDAFERASHAEALRQSEKLKSALLDAVSKVEMMEVIDEESDRLSRFINGLIELARIEAGELHLRRRWGAVEEIISTALDRAEPITRQHHVEVDIERELPGLRVDESAVSEVVYTLIDNAAKYSAKGSTIRIVARPAGDELIQMSVEDEGRGIPVDLRERVFDKFFRATRDGDVSTQQPSGTGMGLAIAKGIIEAHDGKIWIESGAGGKGTRVIFTLPIGDEEIVDGVRYSAVPVEKQ